MYRCVWKRSLPISILRSLRREVCTEVLERKPGSVLEMRECGEEKESLLLIGAYPRRGAEAGHGYGLEQPGGEERRAPAQMDPDGDRG